MQMQTHTLTSIGETFNNSNQNSARGMNIDNSAHVLQHTV